jgi:DNA-binding protein HU-beta
MNKGEFISYIAKKQNLSQAEAEKIINIFTDSVISSLGEGQEISLIGFGSFTVSKVESREGRNPKTGAPLKIAAYNQPKFKAGQKLKDACNKKK